MRIDSYWTQATGQPPRWWEQFLEIEFNPTWGQNKLALRCRETGRVVRTGSSLIDIHHQAEYHLNKLFEEIVLG